MGKERYWKRYWDLLHRFRAFHQTSQELYENSMESFAGHGTTWLDAGCGRQPLPSWSLGIAQKLVSNSSLAVGCDRNLPSLKDNQVLPSLVQCDLAHLPFLPQAFSLVTLNMVVEHLEDPEAVFREIARVVTPGGAILIHTPNRDSWDVSLARLIPSRIKKPIIRFLEQRAEDDIFPTVYKANRIGTLRRLFEPFGLHLEVGHSAVTPPRFIPVPFLFVPLTVLAILEVKILRLRSFQRFRHNLVVLFRKAKPGTLT